MGRGAFTIVCAARVTNALALLTVCKEGTFVVVFAAGRRNTFTVFATNLIVFAIGQFSAIATVGADIVDTLLAWQTLTVVFATVISNAGALDAFCLVTTLV